MIYFIKLFCYNFLMFFLKNGISGILEEWKKKILLYEEVFELVKKMVGICVK